MRMYGITNCDTVKTARAWLSEHGIAYRFVDLKKTPPLKRSTQRMVRGSRMADDPQPARHDVEEAVA